MTITDMLSTAVLLVPLLLLAMTGNWWGVSPLKPVLKFIWAPFALAGLVQFGFGLLLYGRTLLNLLRLRVDANTLAVAGASAAFGLAFWEFRHLTVPADPDALLIIWRDAAFGASLVAVVLLGQITQRSSRQLPAPPRARAAQGRLVIEPGAFIPSDGVVLEGVSEIQDPVGADDVFPIIVKAGARVHAGARNGDGALTIQSVGSAPASALQIVDQRQPDRVQRIVNCAAGLMLAAALGVAAWRYAHSVAGQDAVTDALRLIAMATPLGIGLVLAAPASEVLNAALRLGIDIRDVTVLDRLRRVGAVVVGHRGVLVPDHLRLISAQCVEGVSGSDLIKRVAAVAQLGHEPWGKAVLDFAVGYRMRLKAATDYKASVGEGMMAQIDGQQTIVGTREFVESRGVSCLPLNEAAKLAISQGRRLRWVAEATPTRRVIGFIAFGAPTLSGAAEATKNLHRLGLKTAWLAQTNDPAHLALAKHLKIGRVISEQPEDVVEGIANLRNKYGPLLLVTADTVPEGLAVGDVVLPFGPRIVDQLPGTALATARHDPRLIVDLLSLAARHRQVVLANAVMAFGAAILLAFFPQALGTHSDLASYEVAMVLLLAIFSLGLRAVPTTANEVDEE